MSKQPTARVGVSTVGFVLIILGIVGVGLGLVMVVTTSIGAQSRELSALSVEADELEYQSAGLSTRLEDLSSTGSLALRATELGMVPNPYAAYVMLGSEEVLGEPTPVTGREFPQLIGRAPEPSPSPSASPSPVVTPTPLPPDATAPAPEQPNTEALAAAGGEAPAPETAPTDAPQPPATPDTAESTTAAPTAAAPEATDAAPASKSPEQAEGNDGGEG